MGKSILQPRASVIELAQALSTGEYGDARAILDEVWADPVQDVRDLLLEFTDALAEPNVTFNYSESDGWYYDEADEQGA